MSHTNAPEASEPPLLNIANALTVTRIILIPVFIWVFWEPTATRSFWAWVVFAVAAFTDRLDGQLARSRGLITNFGKLADSIADKGLIAAALIMLSLHDRLWWWVTILMISREIFITLVRMLVVTKQVMAAGWIGKLKMFAQSIGAGILMLPWIAWLGHPGGDIFQWLGWITLGVALVLSVWSAIGYVGDAVRIARGGGHEAHS
ncbi:CDP-diacylglycerol--glycerol-3-phosphate 3-phosphatidyltransferase [Actinotignum sp. UMB0459]|uniref:CDP-diacylglycerol--glycerol-3-phosphate 3-phosphatidyltransferase n=1 Tax=unclassified Actinotignum TaxID=2632702 RepID=UPI002A832CA7|nr:CDP-diacylglycerol--glycerol-3-phosphate 3-phosphatidyltransferase [Actinotignum sp. SLA_B059]MDY5128074.1 CDP-diacylglycerol--glycerol-3-phosphate 3-phosphatidyltransferase [Actinotignum sp. SLA_B059]